MQSLRQFAEVNAADGWMIDVFFFAKYNNEILDY